MGPPHPPITRRSSFKPPVNLEGGGEGGVRLRYQLFPSFPVTHTLFISHFISRLRLFAMFRLAFRASYFTVGTPFSHSQQLHSQRGGGTSTSAFSSAAQSKRPSIITSLGRDGAPRILTRFNFHISAPAVNIICNYSLVSPDSRVKNNKIEKTSAINPAFFFFFHLSI